MSSVLFAYIMLLSLLEYYLCLFIIFQYIYNSIPSKECYKQKKVHPNCTSVVDIHYKEVQFSAVQYSKVLLYVSRVFQFILSKF